MDSLTLPVADGTPDAWAVPVVVALSTLDVAVIVLSVVPVCTDEATEPRLGSARMTGEKMGLC